MSHKFGFRLSKIMKEALKVNKIGENKLWKETMKKEMTNILITFKPH